MSQEESGCNVIAKNFSIAGLFLMFALTSAAQAKEQTLQEDNSPVVCGNGFHEASWMQFPVDDLPGRPSIPPKEVKACFPNCPKSYRQVPGFADALLGHPACLLVESETDKSGCIPDNFELVYQRVIPLVWHWRAEISQQCAAVLLKTPIEPQYHRVREELHGEGTAHFLVVGGLGGRVIDSKLIDFYYTTIPPADALKTPLSPALPSSLAADALKHLEFKPYVFRNNPVEFKSRITILFKLNRQPQ
jgi:hypothetical protein